MRARDPSFTLLLLFLLSAVESATQGCSANEISAGTMCVSLPDIIKQLFNITKEAQVQSGKDVIFPPFLWAEKKGLYGSAVKMNFHGDPEMALMRETFNIFDNNMFATAWITVSLIEAYKYGGAPKPSDEQIRLSVEAIGHFHDKNRHQPNSIMTFWTQVLNETTSCWECAPDNLLGLFQMVDDMPWNVFEDILELLGLKAEAKYIADLLKDMSYDIQAFHIPPDFDDTSVNLGLGALLTEFKDDFPESYKLWMSQNTALDTIWSALKMYAYRPFSNNSDVNTIDPRTYFYIRGFLENARAAGNDVALIPTWVQNLKEDRQMVKRGVGMPFNMNNVDVTVSANAIYGITSAILSGLANASVLNDLDINKIYSNTSAMLVWEIEQDFAGRKDLALTYYPSEFEFYWFVARTFALLEKHARNNQTLPETFQTVRVNFGRVLRGHVTQVITRGAHPEGDDKVYFDDFLGDGDVTIDGTHKVRGQDRIFTTAMAVNTLLYTWSVQQPISKRMQWVKGTPANVTTTVRKASKWLRENALSGKYKPWNAFFSGSDKGDDTVPYWYPFNRLEYLNGTKIPLNSTRVTESIICGFQGVTSEGTYATMLNQTHFGKKTPLTFKGYNSVPSFPFWSSDAYTHVTAMLALAQVQSLADFT